MKTLFVLLLLSGFICGMETEEKIVDAKKEQDVPLYVSILPHDLSQSPCSSPCSEFSGSFQSSPDDNASYREWAAYQLLKQRHVSNLD
jgi:hypothetical protein